MPSERLSWRDLYVVVRQAGPGSALVRGLRGEEHPWGLPEQLLAVVADELRVANWQRSGGKRKDAPKPIPRPGVEDKSSATYGRDAVSIDEMAAWLGWPAPGEN